MKLLDRYILKKYLTTFVFVMLITIVVVSLIDYSEKNADFIKHRVSTNEIFKYFIAFIPFIINFIAPIIVFLSTVFITSKLAQHAEIIAMLSNGISFARILVPYFIGACIIALCSFVLNGWILGNANKYRIMFEKKYIYSKNYDIFQAKHIQIDKNIYFYLKKYDVKNQVGKNVTLEKIENNRLVEKLTAKYITWLQDQQKWQLSNWHIRKIDGLNEYIQQGNTLDTTLNLFPKDLRDDYKLNETLTLTELNKHIDLLKKRGADNIHLFLIEKYVKYMSPFSIILLTFIGMLSACRKVRGGMGYQIAIGFIISAVYVVLFMLSKGSAEAGVNNPLFVIWMPNIIFSCLGMLIYRLIPK